MPDRSLHAIDDVPHIRSYAARCCQLVDIIWTRVTHERMHCLLRTPGAPDHFALIQGFISNRIDLLAAVGYSGLFLPPMPHL